jgi:radical SAM superfamily enzyme YgiQ (UPF0313 family)
MSSITLVSVPRTSLHIPSPALAALKSSVETNGHECFCIDLNIELYQDFLDNFNEYKIVDTYFQTDLRYLKQNGTDLQSLLNIIDSLPNTTKLLYDNFLEKWSSKILEKNTNWIGISVLSVNSIIPTIDLCKKIKSKSSTPIVIGGPGVSTFGIMGSANLGEFLKSVNLINEYIQGEGEYSLVDLLNGTLKNHYEQIDNLDELPIPDYSDFDFTKYSSKNNAVAITGSRGCVRNCSFCDIKAAWKKYRYRSGKSVAEEFLHHNTVYGSTDFQFTDSLVNGSLKSFNDFLDSLIDYKEKGLINKNITWSGQFICRPKSQFGETWYKKMSESGAKQLQIGIESGSESVMHDMGKKLSIDDIEYTLQMLLKYKIQCDMLMIIGYPTETLEDFNKTINMLEKFSYYSDQGVISGVNLGKTMVVLPGSPIGENLNHWGIEYDDNKNWISLNNPSLNFKERVRRRVVAQKKCEELGYIVKWPITTLTTLKQSLENSSETI